ncbi:MAG TPA: DUF1343 domain-containing protein [Verrucomicrobiae bacterium]|jgi:uncharacterized protein YbbC (DUF1343 family)|nr:DUF1343 domain-containing protein [Verrucomicrobiae bacterium]
MKRSLVALLLGLIVVATPAVAGTLPPAKVVLGDEVFLQSAWHDLHGRCVGIITNQTGVTSRLVNIVDEIRSNPHICLKAIYSPEHGLRGDRPAGSYVSSYIDERTGLPVYSLYGPQKHPTAAMLAGVDVLLFDIQDVGARPYTFVSTMAYAMQAAAQFGKEIWILDRPNPIGGTVEGPVLDPQFTSFIGLYPIAMRHGMTVGELAAMFDAAFGIHAKLRVIAMRGWTHAMLWPDTGLQWVQTSPNIPEWSTTVVYVCTGLIDNAGVNGGIGTTKPFKYAGAYLLDAYALAKRLNARDLPGVYFRPAYWSPSSGFWQDKDLGGVELDVYDPSTFQAVRASVELLTAVRDLSPRTIKIDAKPLDIDWGTASLRLGLTHGDSADQILAAWQPAVNRFKTLRAKYLLYP